MLDSIATQIVCALPRRELEVIAEEQELPPSTPRLSDSSEHLCRFSPRYSSATSSSSSSVAGRVSAKRALLLLQAAGRTREVDGLSPLSSPPPPSPSSPHLALLSKAKRSHFQLGRSSHAQQLNQTAVATARALVQRSASPPRPVECELHRNASHTMDERGVGSFHCDGQAEAASHSDDMQSDVESLTAELTEPSPGLWLSATRLTVRSPTPLAPLRARGTTSTTFAASNEDGEDDEELDSIIEHLTGGFRNQNCN